MTEAVDHIARVRAQFKDAIGGAVKELATVNQELETAESLVVQLRAQRSELTKMIRGIDKDAAPSLYANKKPNGKKPAGPLKGRVLGPNKEARARMDALTDYVQANRDELNADGGFRAIDLEKRADFQAEFPIFISTSKGGSPLSKYLDRLYQGGILHLDRWVRGQDYEHRPAGKFYKVV